MSKQKKDTRKWYEVTITESYCATYKILAEDSEDATDIANELVICDIIDPTNDGGDSYDREIGEIELTDAPDDDDMAYSRDDLDD